MTKYFYDISLILLLGAFFCITSPTISWGYETKTMSLNVPPQPMVDTEEDVLIPNLSINFTLNSAADPEATKYYAQIVRELLKKLPRRIELSGKEGAFIREKPQYDHLKVITYLPTSDDINDNTQKDIRYFNVEFEIPKGLVNLEEVKTLPKGVTSQSIVIHEGSYEDYETVISGNVPANWPKVETPLEKGTISRDLFAEELAKIVQTKKVVGAKKGVKTANKADTPPTTQTALMNEIQNFKTKQKLVKKGSKTASKLTKTNLTKPKPESLKKITRAPTKPTKPTSKLKGNKIHLKYVGELEFVTGSELEKLLSLVTKFKGEKLQKIHIVSQTNLGIGDSLTSLPNVRLLKLRAFMREQGVDESIAIISEIRLYSKQNQFIELILE